jgi:signal transduction histidine kinase
VSHGGTIDVTTNPHGGASFHLRLPRKPQLRRVNGA